MWILFAINLILAIACAIDIAGNYKYFKEEAYSPKEVRQCL